VTQPSSPENPWPVRAVAIRVAGWIDKLGTVWVEGQLTQLNMRPDAKTVFMVLRDPAADMSLTLTCPRDLVRNAPVKLAEGTQVVVCGKPNFYTGRGTFSLRVSEIRAVGLGELLARIDRLRRLLDAEGLFDVRLKRPIPFLPNTIGLITGRASAAERDVTSVAEARWPAVRFAIRNTIVQGPNAVAQIVEALRDLDADPDVDVIVVARGGGSVEDLLPFSDETLCRAIAACTTPVVSAIGHEPDSPLCDLVADLRAATPTDAAKRVVPDAVAEQALVSDLRRRSARAHAESAAQQTGARTAARCADRADGGDPPRPRRRAPRRHPPGRIRDRPGRALVGAPGHTWSGGDAGARVRRRAGRVGFHGRAAFRRGRSCGHAAADPCRRRCRHYAQRGVR
jgi:exodeoxyribonuclease VII large subunit